MLQENKGTIGKDSKPLSESLAERFSSLMDTQEKFLSEIQIRLHGVLDRSAPVDCASESVPPIPSNDFFGKLNKQIQRISDTNNSLRRILSHLEEII